MLKKFSWYQQPLSSYLRVNSRCHYQHERNFVCFQSRINYMQTKRGEATVRPSHIHVYFIVTFNENSDIVIGRIAQFYLWRPCVHCSVFITTIFLCGWKWKKTIQLRLNYLSKKKKLKSIFVCFLDHLVVDLQEKKMWRTKQSKIIFVSFEKKKNKYLCKWTSEVRVWIVDTEKWQRKSLVNGPVAFYRALKSR